MDTKNIFEELRVEHEIQRTLLKSLVSTSGDSPERRRIFNKLKKELKIHAAAEERCLYIPMLTNDMSQKKARHSISEHQEIDEMLKSLDKTPFSSPSWLLSARQLKDRVEHHLKEEEREIFQIAGKILKENRKAESANLYRKLIKNCRKRKVTA